MKSILFIVAIFSCLQASTQSDSINLNEVVITATKTERSLISVPMPVSIIKAKIISMSGSSRLQDILSEQNGLSIVPQINGFGNGLQLQGLNPDYTMILIDGEPLIGRLTGNLELNRITVANIKRIEIVKGPSSSLYGSEALGGVINIITHSPEVSKLNLGLKYASNNTLDASLQTNLIKNDLSISVFGNHFRTAGFDLSPNIYGQTVSPYYNSTLQLKLKKDFRERHIFSLSGKSYFETQENEYQVVNGLDSIRVFGHAYVKDFSLNPQYKLKLANHTFINTSVYGSFYETNTQLFKNDSREVYYTDSFQQLFIRPEIQASCYFQDFQKWTAGIGSAFESVKTSRYADSEQRNQQTNFVYIQHEWTIKNRFEIVSGIRYDLNTIYGSQWSPKFAAQWSVGKRWKLKSSFGTGFKAPDFRYLYLNFKNAAAGYFVFGTNELKYQIEKLKNNGEIQQLFYDVNLIGKLDPEKSMAINAGFQFYYNANGHVDVNFFRNDLEGLIESQPIALTIDQKTIYSYSNIKRAFTQGLEFSVIHKLNFGLHIEMSSQILFAMDKEILDQINQGQVFGRDPISKETYRIKKSDYFGLYNRSRHTESLKLFYENKKHHWDASIRLIYKGKFGISNTAGSVQGNIRPASDINGNSILDQYDQFVDGYILCNVSISKNLLDKFRIQLGADNLFNYIDSDHIPSLFGRNLYLNVNYKLYKK
ncbi:MAG: TonB-dependent receptor [Saprospiraceae bacterium]|nr:TonB-dependent receptor [Saprospiraceae bacterium]